MKNTVERINVSLARRVVSFCESRNQQRIHRAEKKMAKIQHEIELENQKLRARVSGPDTSDGVKIWMDVIGRRPKNDISEIYAIRIECLGRDNYLSFRFDSEEALVSAVSHTYWCSHPSSLFSPDYKQPRIYPPIPSWPSFWLFQPDPASKKGGSTYSRPLLGDGYYYYLDIKNSRFFLYTGMTHADFETHIQWKNEKNSPCSDLE
jgi:hypothetical protein